jgi:tetratricopeptide (TPR) repeat protein
MKEFSCGRWGMGRLLRIAMVRILEIALNIFLSLLGLGFAGWIFICALKRSHDPAKLIFKWAFTAVVVWLGLTVAMPAFARGGFDAIYGLILTMLCGLTLAITWRHSIADLIANPIGSLYDGGREEIVPKPYYSVALTKRKLNHPLEAVVAIREQLAKFPNDFEGVSLLASIQAEDMKDLPGAEITFNHFCERPEAPPRQVAAAWTQMADWHLKLAQDADSARASLEKIIAKFPGSELSSAAAQRIAHLGGTEKILLAAHDRQAMAVPEGVKNIGLLDSTAFLRPAETDPKQLAADFVKHLEKHPLDTDVRERLAIIYARHYQRLDLAELELAQLIDEPNRPPKRVAHWLNLLADLQIHGGADYQKVRETLEKIITRFPGLPVADLAQSRLNILKLEIKGQKETPNKTLGVYEQNIGLKYGSPRQL